jgi:hypothetical protein
MDFENTTRFPAQLLRTALDEERLSASVLMRITYDIVGHELVAAAEQTYGVSPEPWESPHGTFEQDQVFKKGGVDLFLFGNAYAPGGRRTVAMTVSMDVDGRGYLLERTPQAVEALALPNIEDPHDPITKRDIDVVNVKNWPRMPLPWGTNWLHPAFFPRVAYLGASRQFGKFEGPWPEVKRGFADEGWPKFGAVEEVMDVRFYNGGSLGMQFPQLQGTLSGIELRLSGLHKSRRDFCFRLPDKPPTISVDGRNKTLKETVPVVHHVVVRPDDDQVHVVWRGRATCWRPYTGEELERMPYRVDWD